VSAHLTSTVLNCLADGELSPEQLAIAQQHLETCSSCTSNALGQALLKAAVSKSGHRYSAPPELADRLKQLLISDSQRGASPSRSSQGRSFQGTRGLAFAGWAVAALLLLAASIVLVQRNLPQFGQIPSERTALVVEISDMHVAALSDTAPAQVISTDRHTVKPWFQGKIPFTFNLPEQLPADAKLDGANLTYLGGQPVAHLLYSIGRHRVSVFLCPRRDRHAVNELPAEHSGFHLAGFTTGELEAVAISDVDPARLAELTATIERAQADARK